MEARKPPVIVTDVQYRKAFDVCNIVRHLGYPVIPTRSKTGFWQKLKAFVGFPEQVVFLDTTCASAFEQGLQTILAEHREKCCLIAGEERTTEMLCANPELLGNANIEALIPSAQTFDLMVDKGKLMEYCEKEGIDHPKSFVGRESILAALDSQAKPSWVLKPRRGTGAEGILYLEGDVDIKVIAQLPLENYVLQEKIVSDSGVRGGFFLCKTGKIICAYSHERIRTYPATGGVTVYSKFVQDPALVAIGNALFEKLQWNGYAMIECIKDIRDGRYKIIEVNPRLWGSVLLGEFCGAGLISQYLEILNNKIPENLTIHANAKIRWLFPYDLILWLKKKGKISAFWRFDRDTCHVGWTYAPKLRALLFQIANVMDPANIAKFFKKS